MLATENLVPKPLPFEIEERRKAFFENALSITLLPALRLADHALQTEGNEVRVNEAIIHPTAAIWATILDAGKPAMDLNLQFHSEDQIFLSAAGLEGQYWARAESSCAAHVTVEQLAHEIQRCIEGVRAKIYDPAWYYRAEEVPIRPR